MAIFGNELENRDGSAKEASQQICKMFHSVSKRWTGVRSVPTLKRKGDSESYEKSIQVASWSCAGDVVGMGFIAGIAGGRRGRQTVRDYQ